MIVTAKEKSTETFLNNIDDIENSINIATQTLERNISFIANCDNKTSIVLASIGVLLTIILTNNGINEIFKIIKSCISEKNFCNVFYLICFFISISVLLFGFYNLCSVLIARTQNKNESNSLIFFSGIIKNGNKNSYFEKFVAMSQEEYLDDLISEIYINASIATTKYKKYNLGFKCTAIGFVAFIIILLSGVYLY